MTQVRAVASQYWPAGQRSSAAVQGTQRPEAVSHTGPPAWPAQSVLDVHAVGPVSVGAGVSIGASGGPASATGASGAASSGTGVSRGGAGVGGAGVFRGAEVGAGRPQTTETSG
jgi:hypothetical protein